MKEKKKPVNYVDNKLLYTEMVKHTNAYKAAIEAGTETPPVNRYIARSIQQIAEGLSHNRNFIRYSYREEMISDGIYSCLKYLHNFNPDKSHNPFAYFTTIIYYAFLQRIEKEKKQSYIKYKAMENSIIMNDSYEMAPGDVIHFQGVISDMDYDKLKTLSTRFDPPPKKEKAPKPKKGLDNFMGDA